ncbi:MAG: hypothetical protein QGH15_12910 [Kiritimatiellia bacterium]|nr:hypothetical protein [Kiritimatiellia bacterium]
MGDLTYFLGLPAFAFGIIFDKDREDDRDDDSERQGSRQRSGQREIVEPMLPDDASEGAPDGDVRLTMNL